MINSGASELVVFMLHVKRSDLGFASSPDGLVCCCGVTGGEKKPGDVAPTPWPVLPIVTELIVVMSIG